MDKIKITREQEEAFKDYLVSNNISGDYPLNYFVKAQKQNGLGLKSWSVLNKFTPQEFALLLCDWYEVEEEYESGDWVILFTQSGVKEDVTKVISIPDIGYLELDLPNCIGGNLHINLSTTDLIVRHATKQEIKEEKERRKQSRWSKIGREVDDLKENDLVHVLHEGKCKYGVIKNTRHVDLRNNIKEYFIASTYGVSGWFSDEYLTLLCPAECRFDLIEK